MKNLILNSYEDVVLTESYGVNTKFSATINETGVFAFEIKPANGDIIRTMSKDKRKAIEKALKIFINTIN